MPVEHAGIGQRGNVRALGEDLHQSVAMGRSRAQHLQDAGNQESMHPGTVLRAVTLATTACVTEVRMMRVVFHPVIVAGPQDLAKSDAVAFVGTQCIRTHRGTDKSRPRRRALPQLIQTRLRAGNVLLELRNVLLDGPPFLFLRRGPVRTVPMSMTRTVTMFMIRTVAMFVIRTVTTTAGFLSCTALAVFSVMFHV